MGSNQTAFESERERKCRIEDEIAEVKRRIESLKTPTGYFWGIAVSNMPLTKLLETMANVDALRAVEKQLRKADINNEACEWLEEAIANLDEFTRYAIKLESDLWERLIELEDDLDSTEQSQNEMNREAGESLNRSRL